MSKKDSKKSLFDRVMAREKVNLAEYTINEIEDVIKQLVELRLDRVRSEQAIRLLEAVSIAVNKAREILQKEEK